MDRVDAGDASAVLLEILPGPMAQFARRRPDLARAAGQACGTVHAPLAEVPTFAGPRYARDGSSPAGCTISPAAPRAWACAFMLSDLAGRYAAHELQHVTDALDEARAASGDPA